MCFMNDHDHHEATKQAGQFIEFVEKEEEYLPSSPSKKVAM